MKRKGEEGTVRWFGSNFGSWFRGWWRTPAMEQDGGGGIHVVSNEAGGHSITPDLALTLSAVWACTKLIAGTIATLPLGMYRRTSTGRETADELQIANVIAKKPNDDQTAVNFWECICGQAILLGNGFARKLYSGPRIVGLELMSTNRLTWRRLPNGSYEFKFTQLDGKQVNVPEREVFHLPGVALWGKFGLSTILYGARTFGSGLAANDAALSTFRNGLHASNYFKMDRVLTAAQRDEFNKNTKARISGALNAGAMPLLEGGMDVGSFGLDPETLQLLESRTFSKEEICTWFGVPPSMIGAGDKASSWASSAESLNLWFLQYTLTPWLKRIEQAVWKDLLSPAERDKHYAEFSVEGLLRGDTAARQSLYASALQNGWMCRDEIRKLENLPPIPDGGGVFTVQSNLIPIEKLGQEEAAPAVALEDALKNFLQLTQGAENGNAH